MTHRLYYTDSYLRDFEATVTGQADDAKRIYLDKTAFYPASGGQPFDTGELNGVRVIDVVDEGERIAHLVAVPLADQRVVGRIDWARRFDHMQQHTGQHLLSAVVAELLGRGTLAVHFGKEISTVDVEGGPLTPDEAAQVEMRANELVTENRPVNVDFQEAHAAEGLRKRSSREGSLRIVTIQDLDRSACGGTHVRATGEIGAILIRKHERIRTGVRLEFVCGGRAIRQARADHEILSELAAELTAAPAEVPQLIKRLRADLKDLRTTSQQLQTELNLYRARQLYSESSPGPDGIRRVLCRQDAGSLDEVRSLGQAVTSMPLAVFIGATRQPPALVLATSRDSGVDAGKVLKTVLAGIGGRGGGSPVLAQGTVTEAAHLDRVITALLQPST